MTWNTGSRERGQGSMEVVGITAVAAILIGAVMLALTTTTDLTSSIKTGICKVTTLGQGDCGSVDPPSATAPGGDSTVPTYMDPSLTPQQQAESGTYVGLGDSFSSGEGGSEYDPLTDENYESESEDYWNNHDEDGNPTGPTSCGGYNPYTGGAPCQGPPQEDPYHNICHRSEGAYPQQINEEFDFAGGYTFAACSGAVTDDFTNPNGEDPDKPWKGNDGEIPQLDHLDEGTSLVTFSIGGNDAKFADTLSGCITDGMNPFHSCFDDDEENDEATENIERAIENLRELLPQVRERAPNARILVVGYPRFFPEDPGDGWGDGTQIDTEDILAINQLVADMNEGINGLVDELNEENPGSFEYVDVYDAFDGCEIGTDNPCMNNIEVGMSDGKPDKNGSYHPNDLGHEQLAEEVENVVINGG